jgi:outer membrane protein OmpU|tara:strand:+ start:605 stop:1522 length:918 start_codon:yes stop_codon:yes gene_type:complete
MNNLKKLGLTALAGSLVASTAVAGSLDVSGTAKVKYQSKGSERVSANPWSDATTITFSGSGDLDNGMALSYGYTMANAIFSSSKLALDMGDAGVISFGNVSHQAGISKYSDVMPTAGEQVWDDVDATDNGVTDLGADNTLGYEMTMNGITASASYARTGLGTDNSIVLIANELVDGASFGIGSGTNVISNTSEDDMTTMWAKYTAGAATFGVQLSQIDKTAANSDLDREAASISVAVNENLSVSYGISTVEYELSTKSDEESSGFSASYTMGSMTLGAVANKTDSISGTAGTDYSFTEVSLAFAF